MQNHLRYFYIKHYQKCIILIINKISFFYKNMSSMTRWQIIFPSLTFPSRKNYIFGFNRVQSLMHRWQS